MHIKTQAIVLRVQTVDEFDRIVTLLSRDRGIITAYARGAGKPKGNMRVATELLSYSCFVLFHSKDRYSIDRADTEHVFMNIRGDVEKLSLASYLCQVTQEVAPHEHEAGDYLRLLLNSLHMLDAQKRACNFIKPVYELRLMTMAGFMPDLVGCGECGMFEGEEMRFYPLSAMLLCGNCAKQANLEEPFVPLSAGLLTAMRHITYGESEKLFAFTLPEAALNQLNEITQNYVMLQTDKRFKTLDFYLSLLI